MNYRVILNYKVYPFNSYLEAWNFVHDNGGIMYRKEYSCVYGR